MAQAIVFLALAVRVASRVDRSEQGADSAEPDAPLFDNLGHHHHPVTTRFELPQRFSDQEPSLAYGFNHAAAGHVCAAVWQAADVEPSASIVH